MKIQRRTVYELPNGDKFQRLDDALTNLRLLGLQKMLAELFPDEIRNVGGWAKAFAAKGPEVLRALQKLEADIQQAITDHQEPTP